MAHTHIVEMLIAANKKMVAVINKVENDQGSNRQMWIDDINTIIRELDHIVEHLEK